MAGDLGSLHSLTGDRGAGAGGREGRRGLLRAEAWLVTGELVLVFMLHRLLVMLPSKSWTNNTHD